MIDAKMKPEPTIRQRIAKLLTPYCMLIFLSGLACFVLALAGKDEWASTFGAFAVLAVIFG